jgi:hypothetical protein
MLPNSTPTNQAARSTMQKTAAVHLPGSSVTKHNEYRITFSKLLEYRTCCVADAATTSAARRNSSFCGSTASPAVSFSAGPYFPPGL